MTPRKTYPLALLAAATLVAAGCSTNDNDDPAPAAPVNVAPVVSAIADQTADQDTVVGPLTFTVSDADSAADALTVVVSTNTANVIPADGIVVTGTGGTRTLTVTPFEAATGATTVAVLVRDQQGLSSTSTFRVTFNARNASFRDATFATFAKSVGDAPTPVRGVTFAQDADDPGTFASLVPAAE